MPYWQTVHRMSDQSAQSFHLTLASCHLCRTTDVRHSCWTLFHCLKASWKTNERWTSLGRSGFKSERYTPPQLRRGWQPIYPPGMRWVWSIVVVQRGEQGAVRRERRWRRRRVVIVETPVDVRIDGHRLTSGGVDAVARSEKSGFLRRYDCCLR